VHLGLRSAPDPAGELTTFLIYTRYSSEKGPEGKGKCGHGGEEWYGDAQKEGKKRLLSRLIQGEAADAPGSAYNYLCDCIDWVYIV